MSKKPSIAVIGAGLGGLAAGIKLKEAGFDDVVILEKAAKVGGTWRDNSYPGCCCDVPVALYQYSFAPSLNWSHLFPRYNEIQKYAEDLADNFGLRPQLKLNEETKSAVWDDARAVQIIPEIAKVTKHLSVFQRTPNWVVPRLDRAITDEEKALAMTAPHVAMMGRDLIYQNSDYLFWQAFSWTKEGRAAYTRVALNHLAEQVPDAALRKKLTPDYPIGCKRILFADDYYPALMRDNVSLVTDKIKRITPAGIDTVDGKSHAFDVIVYATGFETTGWHWSVDVVGKGGRRLHDEWAESPQAYLGITVAKFPNMFVLYGPNTNLGHNSITFMLERQVEYAVKAVQAMHARNLAAVEVKQAAQERFNRDLQTALAKTTWADPHCRSWYKNAQGHITQNWSSHTRDYAAATAEVKWDDYAVRERALAAE